MIKTGVQSYTVDATSSGLATRNTLCIHVYMCMEFKGNPKCMYLTKVWFVAPFSSAKGTLCAFNFWCGWFRAEEDCSMAEVEHVWAKHQGWSSQEAMGGRKDKLGATFFNRQTNSALPYICIACVAMGPFQYHKFISAGALGMNMDREKEINNESIVILRNDDYFYPFLSVLLSCQLSTPQVRSSLGAL